MTGQEILLTALKYPKDSKTREYYIKLSNLYEDEFGVGWMLKETAQTKRIILSRFGQRLRNKTIFDIVVDLITNVEAEEKEFSYYIGSESVNKKDFIIYSKGLFWMAGYDLLNEL